MKNYKNYLLQYALLSMGVLWCCIMPLTAQVKFQRHFNAGANFESGQSIRVLPNGGYLIIGRNDNTGNGTQDGGILELDVLGNKVREKGFGQSTQTDMFQKIAAIKDTTYVLYGQSNSSSTNADLQMMEINHKLTTILWNRRVSSSTTSNEIIRNTVPTHDGGYVGVAWSNPNGMDHYIFKVNANGTYAWNLRYGGTGTEQGEGVTMTTDNGFMTTGQHTSGAAGGTDLNVTKINSTGSHVSTNLYHCTTTSSGTGDWGRDIIQTLDGGYLVVGSVYISGGNQPDVLLLKLRANMTVQWAKAWGNSSVSDIAWDVKQLADSSYAVAGTTGSSPSGNGNDAFLMKVNKNGTLNWVRTYGSTGSEEASELALTADGGYALSGSTTGFGAGTNRNVYIIKTDVDGFSGCNEATSSITLRDLTFSSASFTPTVNTGNSNSTAGALQNLTSATNTNCSTNDGKTCATAYTLTAADYNNTVFNMTDTVMWFRFVGRNKTLLVKKINFPNCDIDTVVLYKNSCNTGSVLKYSIKDFLSNTQIENYYLKTGTTFLLKIKKSNVNLAKMTISQLDNINAECFTIDSMNNSSGQRYNSSCFNTTQSYAPTQNTPINTINVNFHFMLKPNGLGGWTGNFTETSDGYGNNIRNGYWAIKYLLYGEDTIENGIGGMEGLIQNHQNNQMDYPIGNTTPSLPMRLKINLYKNPNITNDKGIYFHRTTDTTLYGYGRASLTNLKQLYSVSGDRVIDVFFAITQLDPIDYKIRGGAPGLRSNTQINQHFWEVYHLNNYQGNYATDFAWFTSHIFHEIGHNLGLSHTSHPGGGGNCSTTINDQCGDTPNLTGVSEIYDNGDTANCPYVGNNIMDYGRKLVFTPCQLSVIHANAKTLGYVDIDTCAISQSDFLVNNVGGTVVWDTLRRFYGNVVVKSRTTLKIRCAVLMPTNGKIIVERGARLIIEGGYISTNCGGQWDGIEVWGNNSLNHPSLAAVLNGTYPVNNNDHGVVITKLEGRIENAKRGIYTCKIVNNIPDYNYSGGFVLVDSTEFINNQIGIEFAPYLKRNNSRIRNSRFSTIAIIKNKFPIAHIKLSWVRGVLIQNNLFDSFIPSGSNSIYTNSNKGVGILSEVSSFRVAAHLTTGNRFLVAPYKYRNYFKNLHYGIKIYGSNIFNIKDIAQVRNAYFEKNNNAIYAAAAYSVNITKNIIRLDKGYYTTGIYLEGCKSFMVEEDTIINLVLTNGNSSRGIYINNTGMGNEEVYLNKIDSAFISLNASNTNTNTQFKCNRLNNADYHIAVLSGDIKFNQGECISNSSAPNYNSSPAGNTFSTCNTNLITPHLYRDVDDAQPFRYNHHNIANYTPVNTCVSTSIRALVTICPPDSASCPSNNNYFTTYPPINPGIITVRNGTSITGINNQINNFRLGLLPAYNSYKTMLGGYTLSATQMKDSLMHHGNRLPDELLLDVLVKKKATVNEPFFTDTQVKDILVNNAPNTNIVIKAMRERLPALSSDAKNAIENAQSNTAGGRIDTMYRIYEAQHNKAVVYNTFIQYALEDSNAITVYQVIDSLKAESDIESQVKLIEMYIAADSITAANSRLGSLPQFNKEYREFYNLMKYYVDMRNAGRDWLSANTADINKLRQIAATNTKAAVDAKSLLVALIDTQYTLLIEDIENTQARLGRFEEDTVGIESPQSAVHSLQMKVYPNPAKNELVFEFENSEANYQVEITGVLGNVLLSTQFDNSMTTTHRINISSIANGLYLYTISNNGERVKSGRIVIMK